MDLDVRHEVVDENRAALAAPYADTWFGGDRNGDALDRLLADTDATVSVYDGADIVAFGHAVTDGAFVASLRDLVVGVEYRGRGVGRRLVDELVDHPDLESVTEFSLTCPEDLAPFYEACGFCVGEGAVVMNRSP